MNRAVQITILLAMGMTCLAQEAVPRSPYLPMDPADRAYRENTKFEQKLDSQLPLDLVFRDDKGRSRPLETYFHQDKPVVLALVYYRCPAICNAVMNSMMQTFRAIEPEIGSDYEVVTVSFDHTETHETAAAKKQNYVEILQRPGADAGWHFLVGDEEPIRQLCEAVGFSFAFVEETGEFAHKGGILFITPSGRISRYLPGLDYPIRDTEFALMDASEGRIGSIVKKVFALCYAYNPKTGMYGPVINRSLFIGCLAAIAALAGLLLYLIRYDLKRHREGVAVNPDLALETQ